MVMETLKRRVPERERTEQEEYATRGPFASIFGGPVARLFDQALIVGKMEQTCPIKQRKRRWKNSLKWALLFQPEK